MDAQAQAQQQNYYNNLLVNQFAGFKERIDGREIVDDLCDELRGVVWVNGKRVETSEYRMLNEIGIARVRGLLRSVVNKNTHLTKYENNSRVLLQISGAIEGFIVELVCNLRTWSPKGFAKVPNWRLVVQMVEQSMLASMLRGESGFEANLTGKQQQHNVNEVIDRTPQQESGFMSFLRR